MGRRKEGRGKKRGPPPPPTIPALVGTKPPRIGQNLNTTGQTNWEGIFFYQPGRGSTEKERRKEKLSLFLLSTEVQQKKKKTLPFLVFPSNFCSASQKGKKRSPPLFFSKIDGPAPREQASRSSFLKARFFVRRDRMRRKGKGEKKKRSSNFPHLRSFSNIESEEKGKERKKELFFIFAPRTEEGKKRGKALIQFVTSWPVAKKGGKKLASMIRLTCSTGCLKAKGGKKGRGEGGFLCPFYPCPTGRRRRKGGEKKRVLMRIGERLQPHLSHKLRPNSLKREGRRGGSRRWSFNAGENGDLEKEEEI